MFWQFFHRLRVFHCTLTRATILRFFPTPRSVSCTRDLLCCSKLDLGHCRRLCERDNDIINGFQLVPGVSTPPTLLPLLPIMLLLLGEQFVPLLLASARLLQLSECCLHFQQLSKCCLNIWFALSYLLASYLSYL